MKKLIALLAIVGASLGMNSCAIGGAGSTATTNTSAAGTAGSLLTTVLTGDGSNVVGTVLNSLLTGSVASKNSIQGTWVYSGPKVVFESENILAKLGSVVASNKIESTLGAQLKKMGFTAGKSTLMLNPDNTCVLTLNGRAVNGTYTYANNILTIQGALGMASVSCTCTVTGGELYMLYDADKLLTMATGLAAMTSNMASISTLLKSYNGMKLGWAMTRN